MQNIAREFEKAQLGDKMKNLKSKERVIISIVCFFWWIIDCNEFVQNISAFMKDISYRIMHSQQRNIWIFSQFNETYMQVMKN